MSGEEVIQMLREPTQSFYSYWSLAFLLPSEAYSILKALNQP